MRPPRKPEADECCGTGCIPCVYDVYLDQLQQYRRWEEGQLAKGIAPDTSGSPDRRPGAKAPTKS
jgi:hypothetical protein